MEKKQTLHILTRVSTKPQTKKYGLGIQKNKGIRFNQNNEAIFRGGKLISIQMIDNNDETDY